MCPVLQSLWVERTTLTLVQSLPGISRWFEVDKRELVRSHPHLVFSARCFHTPQRLGIDRRGSGRRRSGVSERLFHQSGGSILFSSLSRRHICGCLTQILSKASFSRIFPQISEEREDFKRLLLLQGLQGEKKKKEKTCKTAMGWGAQSSAADEGVKLQIMRWDDVNLESGAGERIKVTESQGRKSRKRKGSL